MGCRVAAEVLGWEEVDKSCVILEGVGGCRYVIMVKVGVCFPLQAAHKLLILVVRVMDVAVVELSQFPHASRDTASATCGRASRLAHRRI